MVRFRVWSRCPWNKIINFAVQIFSPSHFRSVRFINLEVNFFLYFVLLHLAIFALCIFKLRCTDPHTQNFQSFLVSINFYLEIKVLVSLIFTSHVCLCIFVQFFISAHFSSFSPFHGLLYEKATDEFEFLFWYSLS